LAREREFIMDSHIFKHFTKPTIFSTISSNNKMNDKTHDIELLQEIEKFKQHLNSTDIFDTNILSIILISSGRCDLVEKILNDYSEYITKKTIIDMINDILMRKKFNIKSQDAIKLIKMIFLKFGNEFVNSQNKYGNTFLISSLGDDNYLSFILEQSHARLELTNMNGDNVVHCAIKYKDHTALDKILNYITSNCDKKIGSKILNAKNNACDTPLIMATKALNDVAIDLLLNNEHVDVNETDAKKNTSLLLAISANDKVMTKSLLNHNKIDIDQKNLFGISPLMEAISVRNLEIALTILNMYTTEQLNHVDVVKKNILHKLLLLKYEATIDQYAIGTGTSEYLDFSALNNNDYFLLKPANCDELCSGMIYKLFSRLEIDINSDDLFGKTCFALICDNYDIELFNKMTSLEKFDPLYKNRNGVTCMKIVKDLYKTKFKNLARGKMNQIDVKNFEVVKYFYETLKTMTNDTDVEFEAVLLGEISDKRHTYCNDEFMHEHVHKSRCFDILKNDLEKHNDNGNNDSNNDLEKHNDGNNDLEKHNDGNYDLEKHNDNDDTYDDGNNDHDGNHDHDHDNDHYSVSLEALIGDVQVDKKDDVPIVTEPSTESAFTKIFKVFS